ncbi:MAG: hypothetical protein KGN34_16565 [Sphingomonadales bacterium]|nr:hypothetical protein [Sphingomonadales bacterium]
MFGPKLRTVFASRWNALLWAASIMMTAYCTVPDKDQDESGNAATMQAVLGIPAGAPSPATEPHRNPWSN